MNKDKKTERIGYGFNRSDRDFAKAKVDVLFLDTKHTKRIERAEMLHQHGLRPGDVVVVVFEKDLGFGRELKQIRDFIAQAGATIESFGVSNGAKKRPAGTRGIPLAALKAAQPYWHLPGISIDWINDKLAVAGAQRGERWGPYARHQFIHALGGRSDDPKDLPDDPLEEADE